MHALHVPLPRDFFSKIGKPNRHNLLVRRLLKNEKKIPMAKHDVGRLQRDMCVLSFEYWPHTLHVQISLGQGGELLGTGIPIAIAANAETCRG